MTDRRFLLSLGASAVGLLATTLAGAGLLVYGTEPRAVVAELASAVPFAAAAWLTIRHGEGRNPPTTRRAFILVVGVAVALRLLLVLAPSDSTDVYRYVWDGRVQWSGINPYRYVPADPALATLRDQAIYPNINRATYAPTIYPPVAQIIFALAGVASGGVATMKLVMTGFEALTVIALSALLDRRGLPSSRVLLYAWHPLAVFEFAGSGHVDAAAIAFTMLAMLAADRGRNVRSGVLLALGTATKFFPLVAAPALYRRWDWRAPVAGLACLVLSYLPYLSVGAKVLGFLGGYAHEEALDDGTGFFLLGLLDQQMDLPAWARTAYLAAAAIVLTAVAAYAIARRDPGSPAILPALVLLAAFTAFMTPHLPWYFTWTTPLLALQPSWSVLYLTCAAPLLYWQAHAPDDPTYSLLLYLPFYLILAVEVAVRGALGPRERQAHVSYAG